MPPVDETTVHLRQKRDRYYAEFYNADKDPPRKWKSLKTSDRGIALKKLRRWEERVLLGKWDPWVEADEEAAPQLLRELIDEYLTLCRERYGESEQNVDDKRRTYDRLLDLLPSRARPADVTQDVIHEFLNRITGLDGGDPSPHTVYGYFSQIRVLCGWLVKNDHLSENPAATDDVRRRVPTPETSRDCLRPGEINRIERAIRADIDRHPRRDHREYIIHAIHFLAATGLRRSELKYLRLADCTLNEDGTGYIEVRSWEHPETGETFTVKTFDRRVPLYPRAARALDAVAGDRLRDDDADPYESVFLAAQGGRLNDDHFGKYVREYGEDALPGRGVTPHWFRHTYISWSVNELGVTPHKVQQLVGHGSIETTMDYMHLSDGAVSGIIDDVRARHGLGSTGMSMQTREVLEYLFCNSIEEMKEQTEAESLNTVV
jgi:site-specific recombinase XerD